MKIAWVITRGDAVRGASIHVHDSARAMAERGHRVLVLRGGEGKAGGWDECRIFAAHPEVLARYLLDHPEAAAEWNANQKLRH